MTIVPIDSGATLFCDSCGDPVLDGEREYLERLLGEIYQEERYAMKCLICVAKALKGELHEA